MTQSWLRRNRWGLILVIPAFALAMLASSFRFFSIYLPWQADYGREVAEVVISSEESGIEHPSGAVYEATLQMISLTKINSVADPESWNDAMLTAAPGGQLWRLNMVVRADPAMVLVDCTVSLMDTQGRHFTTGPGKLSDGVPTPAYNADLCVPQGNVGPSGDLLNEYLPADEGYERPGRYRKEFYFVLPLDAEPSHVRIDMVHPPHRLIEAPIR